MDRRRSRPDRGRRHPALTVISLYSGAGGIDFGFEAAGFETRVCLDIDSDACRALRNNRPWPVIEADVNHVTPEQILHVARLAPGEADVLVGGPPCQPYSKSGYWWRGDALRLNDPRAGTLGHYLEIVKAIRPRAILFENVDGFGYAGKDEGLQLLLAGLDMINAETGASYRASYKILDAADYGVPQHRSRFFLVAARDGAHFRFPVSTHCAPDLLTGASKLLPYATAWDAIGNLNDVPSNEQLALTGKWADLLPSIPEGRNYLWHTPRGGGKALFGWRTRYWTFLLKLAKDQPSWTLQAQPGPATGPFHWKNRYLSARELCRLQTFPDDVLIPGDRRVAQKLLGNAVPSLLAEILARSIREQLLRLPLNSDKPKLSLSPATPVPACEPVEPVPSKYLHLAGQHAAHPGTGKGPRASVRDAVAEP